MRKLLFSAALAIAVSAAAQNNPVAAPGAQVVAGNARLKTMPPWLS